MLENAIRDVWRRSRSNMHEYGNNSEGLSGNLISTYCIAVTNNPISLGDLSVGSEVLHRVLHQKYLNWIQDDDTPLMRASLKGHVIVVRLLLEKGADVNTCNKVGRISRHSFRQG